MIDYAQYALVFPSSARFPYDRRTLQELETLRRSFGGSLFIDRVLRAVGITKAKIYPPATDQALRSLHQQLCDAEITTDHRLSLFYYILLDFDEASDDIIARTFADSASLPAKYQTMMRGLWHMDRQQFTLALQYISHPSLTADFANDIVTALVRHTEGDPSLALQYYHTVRPVLSSNEAISALFSALVRSSIVEAFFFARTFPEHTRELLLQRLVTQVLGASEATAGAGSEEAPNGPEAAAAVGRARELALLPLDPLEESWFERFLETGEGRGLPRAKDALVVRRVAAGRFQEAKATEGLGPHWGAVLEGLKEA